MIQPDKHRDEAQRRINQEKDKKNKKDYVYEEDKENLLIITGVGDVVEPEHGICAIGSGGNYALAAGRALAENTDLSAREIAQKAMKIAGDICIFTNNNLTIEEVK